MTSIDHTAVERAARALNPSAWDGKTYAPVDVPLVQDLARNHARAVLDAAGFSREAVARVVDELAASVNCVSDYELLAERARMIREVGW